MSLAKPFAKIIYLAAFSVGLSGTIVMPAMTKNQEDQNPFLVLMTTAGRAVERRYDTNFKVTRHGEFRNIVKLASGSRLPLPRLTA